MSNLKWMPREDVIAVFGKGIIKREDFKQEHLDEMIKRAKNRNQDVSSFLLKAGLVKVNPQVELELEAATVPDVKEGIEELTPPQEEKPKSQSRKYQKKEKVEEVKSPE